MLITVHFNKRHHQEFIWSKVFRKLLLVVHSSTVGHLQLFDLVTSCLVLSFLSSCVVFCFTLPVCLVSCFPLNQCFVSLLRFSFDFRLTNTSFVNKAFFCVCERNVQIPRTCIRKRFCLSLIVCEYDQSFKNNLDSHRLTWNKKVTNKSLLWMVYLQVMENCLYLLISREINQNECKPESTTWNIDSSVCSFGVKCEKNTRK